MNRFFSLLVLLLPCCVTGQVDSAVSVDSARPPMWIFTAASTIVTDTSYHPLEDEKHYVKRDTTKPVIVEKEQTILQDGKKIGSVKTNYSRYRGQALTSTSFCTITGQLVAVVSILETSNSCEVYTYKDRKKQTVIINDYFAHQKELAEFLVENNYL